MGIEVKAEILFSEAGAIEAARRGAVTIVVDALRASATTATALAVGARDVIPVLSVEEAAEYVGRPNCRVAGERQGAKCDGFDLGNSPIELQRERERLAGHSLVLSTSNGTRMVHAARDGSAAVLMGTTINARAVAHAAHELAETFERDIVLVAAGEYGGHAEEDYCAARCIAAHLARLGVSCGDEMLREECPPDVFHATPSADELRGLGYEEDIDFCAQSDLFDMVPILMGHCFVAFQAVMKAAVA